ncbi:MAG: ChbG/HpnK family deacetylase [Gammaproteobacteria bacterium]|nr:ChbG/HpnK family deacetylase [Gammaproteobacteria bacterium]
MVSKSIILCADDFGQNASISKAIIHLCQQGRLNAVSCMVNGEAFISHILDLKATNVPLGLHLNLTHGKALVSGEAHFPLSALLQAVYISKRLKSADFYGEIHAQIKAFKQVTGQYPKFIDGHQHVHQLPMIRDALIQAVDACGFKPWFRTTYAQINQVQSLKGLALYFLGGKAFAKKIKQSHFETCAGFAGEYPLHRPGKYPARFQSFLKQIPDGGLIMCHPGCDGQDEKDRIAIIRAEEYQYFSSPEFLADLSRANVNLPS